MSAATESSHRSLIFYQLNERTCDHNGDLCEEQGRLVCAECDAPVIDVALRRQRDAAIGNAFNAQEKGDRLRAEAAFDEAARLDVLLYGGACR
jgi:hypothetical protein